MASHFAVQSEEAQAFVADVPAPEPRLRFPTSRRAAIGAATLLLAAGAAMALASAGRFGGAAPTAPATAPLGLDRDAVVSLASQAEQIQALLGAGAAKTLGALKKSDDLRVAACTLNVVQASSYLARAGVQIDQAVKTCTAPDKNLYKKTACAANAAGVFASIGFVAAHISLSVSQCAKVADVDAVCAATIEGLVAALGGLAVQAGFVAGNCGANGEAKAEANTHTDAIWSMDRRLQVAADGKFAPDRDSELAECVLDVTQATTSLAQMGYTVESSRRGCELWERTKGVPVVNGNTRAICSVHIGHILYRVGLAATFIASATSHCATGINVPALCATGISGLLTSLGGVVYLGSGMALACTELQKLGPLKDPVATLLGQGIARRLGANESSQALI